MQPINGASATFGEALRSFATDVSQFQEALPHVDDQPTQVESQWKDCLDTIRTQLGTTNVAVVTAWLAQLAPDFCSLPEQLPAKVNASQRYVPEWLITFLEQVGFISSQPIEVAAEKARSVIDEEEALYAKNTGGGIGYGYREVNAKIATAKDLNNLARQQLDRNLRDTCHSERLANNAVDAWAKKCAAVVAISERLAQEYGQALPLFSPPAESNKRREAINAIHFRGTESLGALSPLEKAATAHLSELESLEVKIGPCCADLTKGVQNEAQLIGELLDLEEQRLGWVESDVIRFYMESKGDREKHLLGTQLGIVNLGTDRPVRHIKPTELFFALQDALALCNPEMVAEHALRHLRPLLTKVKSLNFNEAQLSYDTPFYAVLKSHLKSEFPTDVRLQDTLSVTTLLRDRMSDRNCITLALSKIDEVISLLRMCSFSSILTLSDGRLLSDIGEMGLVSVFQVSDVESAAESALQLSRAFGKARRVGNFQRRLKAIEESANSALSKFVYDGSDDFATNYSTPVESLISSRIRDLERLHSVIQDQVYGSGYIGFDGLAKLNSLSEPKPAWGVRRAVGDSRQVGTHLKFHKLVKEGALSASGNFQERWGQHKLRQRELREQLVVEYKKLILSYKELQKRLDGLSKRSIQARTELRKFAINIAPALADKQAALLLKPFRFPLSYRERVTWDKGSVYFRQDAAKKVLDNVRGSLLSLHPLRTSDGTVFVRQTQLGEKALTILLQHKENLRVKEAPLAVALLRLGYMEGIAALQKMAGDSEEALLEKFGTQREAIGRLEAELAYETDLRRRADRAAADLTQKLAKSESERKALKSRPEPEPRIYFLIYHST